MRKPGQFFMCPLVVKDIEKSLKVFRAFNGSLKLDHVIEKGFFIESTSSLVLQLCDLCAFSIRKHEEQKEELPTVKAIDLEPIEALKPLIHRGTEPWPDVLAWLSEQEKKGRPGD